MDSSRSAKESGDIAIPVMDMKSLKSGKGAPPPVVPVPTTVRLGHQPPPAAGWKRGVGIIDLILRICAIAATLGAAAVMGTTSQNLPFFTQIFQFQASYDDFPTFTFFLAGNAITCAYLVLSVPFSIVCIVRPHMIGARMLLFLFDTLALALTMAAASAAAAIVYLAHNGNPGTNWPALCQQFNEFCPRVSGAVVGSFLAALILVALVVLSAAALRRN
ncbi:hypothetical protein L6452_29508 [Arctium lappa]|uniref:Uncharacterized protein n=1 Tax=Arctium lappa TaxID=4217 RepID=A0ACB8ZHC8_ARCLA|nr:hypothetical protein L6452_29508 [Arctium lappa]